MISVMMDIGVAVAIAATLSWFAFRTSVREEE